MQKSDKRHIKIVLTGGHAATSALSVVEEFLRQSDNYFWEIFWIGAASAFEGHKVLPLEQRVLPRLGITSYKIVSGRVQRKWSRYTIPSVLKIPLGFFHALFLLIKIRPRIILSFGGFAAFPVVLGGYLLRIPVVIHEQTVAIGLANRVSSFFATKIAISRRESEKFFPSSKVKLIGLPLMSSIFEIFPKKNHGVPPTIYITGGSRGAAKINKVVDEILEQLLKKYIIIHQCGNLEYAYFLRRKRNLSPELSRRYEVYDFIDPADVASVYRRADILISRAGAHTVAEIMATARPSVLIPISWSRYDEQLQNARLAQKSGLAVVITEDKLSPGILLQKIEEILKNWTFMVSGSKNTYSKLDRLASGKLVELIKSCL